MADIVAAMQKVTAGLLVTLVGLTVGLILAPAAGATKCPIGFETAVVRPKAFSPAGHGVSLDRLHWSRWGRHKAVGRGRLLVYDNTTGAEAYSRTPVILDRAAGGLFHRARWRYSDGRKGRSEYSNSSQTWVIQS